MLIIDFKSETLEWVQSILFIFMMTWKLIKRSRKVLIESFMKLITSSLKCEGEEINELIKAEKISGRIIAIQWHSLIANDMCVHTRLNEIVDDDDKLCEQTRRAIWCHTALFSQRSQLLHIREFDSSSLTSFTPAFSRWKYSSFFRVSFHHSINVLSHLRRWYFPKKIYIRN